ncbi:DNA primase [Buchnera aphidicola]|uniref:DNA primase n=1 Tax=Buchnera aphidicola TaxID=9 RepID=UPI00094C8ADF|nr:DNA primase [Buchnera aphidicola]
MYKKIPQNFIHELIERTDIVELISSYITLHKTGNNHKALCPFHQEKTPSFIVSSEKQFFYCFGCQIHGNSIDFLMKYEKLNFIKSITTLAELHGIKVLKNNNDRELEKKYIYKKNIYLILNEIKKIYKKNLFVKPNAAYQYLRQRGIKKKIMKKFSLGFATSDHYQITNYIQKKSKNQSVIIDCGVSVTRTHKTPYDLFKERIIFPIRDKYGKTLGFGGRAFNKQIYPKYINSSETITFHKKNNLYGIYELYCKNPKPKQILVVEGYLDVITLAQFNINNSVAVLGSTVTKNQIKQLFQTSQQIIFCFDGDDAGKKANWIALNLSLSFLYDYQTIHFILLPKNEDPSSLLVKEGRDKFKKRIKSAESLYSFLFAMISDKINLNTIQGCIKLSNLAVPLIKKIPNKIIQIYLRNMLGKKIGISDKYQLHELLSITPNTPSLNKSKPIKITTMRLLVSLIIQNPELAQKIKDIDKIKKLNVIGKTIFLELIQLIIQKKILKTGHLIEFYRHTRWEKIFNYLSTWDHMISQCEVNHIFKELVNNLKIQHLENQYQALIDLEKKNGLLLVEKKKLWNINKKLMKHKNI